MSPNLPINANEIRALASGHWVDIIAGIDDRFSEAAQNLGHHVPCPAGTGEKDGFRFEDNSQTDGHAFSNTGAKLGNGFEVLMWANDWNFRQALEAVHAQLCAPNTTITATAAQAKPEASHKPPKQNPQNNTVPLKIWQQSSEDISDPVIKYLESRGLSEAMPLPKSLRSHASIEYSEGVGKERVVLGSFPGLIGEITKNGKITGIQRHFLNENGSKADVKNPKMMLSISRGSCSGGSVHLNEPTTTLAVCEGIETGLAVQIATGVPTWAATTGTLLSKIDIPADIQTVFIFADKDRTQAGRKHANQLHEKLTKKGINAFIFMPPLPRQEDEKSLDWLDVLNKLGKIPFNQAIEASEKRSDQPASKPQTSQEKCLSLTDPLYIFPEANDKGMPLNVFENFTFMLKKYGIRCQYDVIKKDVDVSIPRQNFSNDNGKSSVRAHVLSTCMRNKFPISLADDYLNLEAEINHVNPVIEWITSKPWDKKNRWADFIQETIRTDEDKEVMASVLVSKWMLSALAMAENGIKGKKHKREAHGILIFTGAQGMGKTSWFKKLVPEGSEFALDGFLLDPNNKDSVRTAISHWLVELGEIDSTFRKSDLSALKAFVTRPTDKLRKPYGRDDSNYPRRTVFFGSVNDREFLMDTTGNRRYWVIEPTAIDYQHTYDMQQVWAEAYHCYQNGMNWWLSPEEEKQLNKDNREFEATDPIEEMIISRFDFEDTYTTNPMTATEVLHNIGFDNPKKGDMMKASRIIEKLTGSKSRRSANKRVFDMPPKKNTPMY